MQILAMHGMVANPSRDKMTHRSMSDAAQLDRYLAHRRRFVSLERALAGDGAALTIDDATEASAEAALLARKHGHEVALFVNPGYLEPRREHFFCRLSSLLDAVEAPRVKWQGEEHATDSPAARTRLRAAVKRELRRATGEEERWAILDGLQAAAGLDAVEIAPHLRTLSLDKLRSLAAAGVQIFNHGWTHGDFAALSPALQLEQIERGRDWLRERFPGQGYFAVPFGDVVLPAEVLAQAGVINLCADDERPLGPIGERNVNRVIFCLR